MRLHGQVGMSAAIRMAAGASLLVVAGSDRGIVTGKDGRRGHVGNTDLFRLLGDDAQFHEFHLGKSLRQLPWIPDLTPYRCILNLISDPDQNPRTLDNLRKLLRGYSGRLINRPEALLQSTRDQVARRLDGIPGLKVPRVIRLRGAKPGVAAEAVQRAGLLFPVILRLAGTHTGNIIGRIDGLEQLQAALTADGEHIVTEFVDFRSADGLCRKYRVFFFGRRFVFRHMLVSDEWNVHAKDRGRFMAPRPALLAEEEGMYARPEGAFPAEVRRSLSAIGECMPLDLFGMDFGIAPDGRIVLFEANATMNFFPFLPDPKFAYVQNCLAPSQRAFRDLIEPEPAKAPAP